LAEFSDMVRALRSCYYSAYYRAFCAKTEKQAILVNTTNRRKAAAASGFFNV
jgi:hypothetical protein